MKRNWIVAAILSLALCVPVFAAEQDQGGEHEKMMKKMHQIMKQNPELKKQLMGNPHHLLAMGYVKSFKSFAHALKKAAKNSETIPQDFLKTSVQEMKRDLDEAEKHHKELLQSLPEEMKQKLGDMPKMMAEHVENARTHLGHLEQLASKEKVDSKEVLKHLKLMMPCDCMEKMHDHHDDKKMKKSSKGKDQKQNQDQPREQKQ